MVETPNILKEKNGIQSAKLTNSNIPIAKSKCRICLKNSCKIQIKSNNANCICPLGHTSHHASHLNTANSSNTPISKYSAKNGSAKK